MLTEKEKELDRRLINSRNNRLTLSSRADIATAQSLAAKSAHVRVTDAHPFTGQIDVHCSD